jgi:DNA modification methylase
MENVPVGQFDIILTSPFYNTNKKAGKTRTLSNTSVKDGQYDYVRYDTHIDSMTNEEYCDFTERLFLEFDRVLDLNGTVLYNINYGAENTDGMFRAINTIVTKTPFTIADVIVWKKSNALPNSCSPNRLTRIWEFVFVFCRKDELKTFNCNKTVTSYRKTGQAMYENVFNYIEAKNNDESCPYNKATFSTDLCKQLLSRYAVGDKVTVYDPFMGSGTTAVACQEMGFDCYGSEISENQVKWAKERLQRCATPQTRREWLNELLGGE